MTNSELTINNGNVLLASGEICKCDLLLKDGIIEKIEQNINQGSIVDAGGAYILPGIIDLHTHGLERSSAGDGSLAEMCEVEAAHGATTFYPTLFAPPYVIAAQMKRHLAETNDLRLTPQIGGFRLESPYIARTGAGISKDLAPISDELTDSLLSAGGGHVKIWDISPELDGSTRLVRKLQENGVVCSIAHTQASVSQAKAVVDAGASLVTHLFCTFVVPEMTEPGAYPAGLVDYILIEDRLTAEIIADGTHVHPHHIEKAYRCKGTDGIAFITDSNVGAGLPSGRYSLGEWGDIVVNGSNNGLRLVDRGMELAGSALTPIDAFRNAVQLFGKDLATASVLCSRTPARVMGLNKGEIAEGKDADIIILNKSLELLYTVVAGKVIYKA